MGAEGLIAQATPADPDTPNEVANAFELWVRGRQATGRINSEATIAAYRSDFSRWATLLNDNNPDRAFDALRWERFNVDELVAASGIMNAAGYSPASRQRSMSVLRGFCRWATKRGYLYLDPTVDDELYIAGGPRKLPVSYNADELSAILEAACDPLPHGRQQPNWPERSRGALALLAGCGLRASETCQIRWSDTQQQRDGTILLRIRGKGGVERVVPAGGAVVDDLNTWRNARTHRLEQLGVADPGVILIGNRGQAVTTRVLDTWVRKWVHDAGVTPRRQAAAHAMRHSFADGLAAAGVPLPSIQLLLGHASIATTGIYTKARPDALGGAVAAGRYATVRAIKA